MADTSGPVSNEATPPRVRARTVQDYLDETPQWRDGTALGRPPRAAMQSLIFLLASAGKLFEGLVVFMTGTALPLIVADLGLTDTQAGLVTATTLCGILVGALFLGSMSDRIGRKTMFVAEMVVFTAFLTGVCFAPNLPVLLFCLFGMGLALGCDYPTAHLMLSETMSSAERGRSVLGAFAFQAVGAVVGAGVAVGVLALLPPDTGHWRVMFGVAVLPALLVTIGRFFVAPSPHWLLAVGRREEAEDALRKVLRRDPPYPSEITLAPVAASLEPRGRFRDLFRRGKGGSLKATILASVPWFLQDLSTYGIGIFTPVIIAASIGDRVDDSGSLNPVAGVVHDELIGAEGAVLIDAFLVVGILVAIRYVNRLGSIRMQIWGFLGCAAGMAVATIGSLISAEPLQTILIFIGFTTFTFMTNFGPNAQTYLIAGEVFPTAVRGTGSGFAAACGKAGAVLTAFLFPVLLTQFGTTPILIVLILCSLAGALVTSIFRIDTTGKSLEELHSSSA